MEDDMGKTIISILVICAMVIGFGIGVHLYRVSQKNKHEMSKYTSSVKLNAKTGRTLVVYYSLSGHTKAIAEKIARYTKADLYEIKTAEKFELNTAFYLKARHQLYSKQYPKLSGKMPNFSRYNTIFVGGPVWWYAPATPLLSFLEKADFKTRKVVPFSTQGSNYGSFFVDFKRMAKNAKLRPHASFNNIPAQYSKEEENKIIHWINSIH